MIPMGVLHAKLISFIRMHSYISVASSPSGDPLRLNERKKSVKKWLKIKQILVTTLDKRAKKCYSSLLMIKGARTLHLNKSERDQQEITGH